MLQKAEANGIRVSSRFAAKPQSVVSTWALGGESCGGRQERSHKDEDPFHGGLQCCPNLAQHRLNDFRQVMVLGEKAIADGLTKMR